MTGNIIIAFVVAPLALVAIGAVAVFLNERSAARHRLHPGE
jgi:hypothetical protein